MTRTLIVWMAVLGAMAALRPAPALAADFTVGGFVYTDVSNPLFTGVAGVAITVDGAGGQFMTTTQGTGPGMVQGLWIIANVPEGTYTVTPELDGSCFQHVVAGLPGALAPIQIIVNQANQAANQSIQFLALDECDCGCDDGDPCTADECIAGACAHTAVGEGTPCPDDLHCNGIEVCAGGTCTAGDAVDCDDGLSCTMDSCNEETDACEHAPHDLVCDDGMFCSGVESCDPLTGCVSSDPIDCNDGLACTIDSCDEDAAACSHDPVDAVCDNGMFCDGAEFCDPEAGCQLGMPVPDCCDNDDQCFDGDACDGQESCVDHACVEGVPPACDDGLLCNGGETCDSLAGCLPGTPIEGCCKSDADCDNADACDGVETCVDNTCVTSMPPECDDGDSCTMDSCDPVLGCLNPRAECPPGHTCIGGSCVPAPIIAGLVIGPSSTCQTRYKRNGNGFLRVLLVGDANVDVTQIDLDTLLLRRNDGVGGAVAPNDGPPGPSTASDDKAHAFNPVGACSCTVNLTADGVLDLSMPFRNSEIVPAMDLNCLAPGVQVILELTGALLDGTMFCATDCIVLYGPPSGPCRSGFRRAPE